MREILFRGKRKDNGEWVYGYLLKGNLAYIVTDADMEYMVVSLACTACMELVEVIPETVGQFTYAIKNGKKIFEGDIVRLYHDDFDLIRIVKFLDGGFVLTEKNEDWGFVFSERWSYEVIGNIHDNPELLKGDE